MHARALAPALLTLFALPAACTAGGASDPDVASAPPPIPGVDAAGPAVRATHPDWPATKEWVRTSFPDAPRVTVPELAVQLEGERPPLLLDARSPAEFAVSHLARARNTPDLERALQELASVPSGTPIVVYCSVGYRSGGLSEALIERGFEDVRNLEGSLFEWANAGLPLYCGGQRAERVHPFDEEWGRLLQRELWSEVSD